MPWSITLLIVFAVIAASIALGRLLSSRWRMPDYFLKITVMAFTVLAGTAICANAIYLQFLVPEDQRQEKIRLGIDLAGGVILVYQLQQDQPGVPGEKPDQAMRPEDAAKVDMDRLIGAISKRINPGGVMEITVRPAGARQIEIIIPKVGPEEVDRIKRILGTVGLLEFRILATREDNTQQDLIKRAEKLSENENAIYGPNSERLAYFVPLDQDKAEGIRGNPNLATRVVTRRGKPQPQVLVIDDRWDVTGGMLSQSRPRPDEKGNWAVNFNFGPEGAAKFGALTTKYQPNPLGDFKYQLGIVLDGVLKSAPQINDPIFSNGVITGKFTEKEVNDLADVLNAGALPRALNREPVSEQYIGPTLGRDTIRRGLNSLVVSVALVFAFVLVYYRFAGVVACIALALNAVLLLAIMITINAAFTLPGLAGFALTIGMAVDANVLIYERMREEAARGSGLRMMIRNGFDKAMSAIVDSNLTTMITAVVLYVIGTDQIRGFAVTLFLGIVLSMYTAIYFGRWIFDIAERQRWLTSIKMMQLIGETHVNWLAHRWMMIGISVVLILIGMVAVVGRGRGLLDIDFTGGVSVQTVFTSAHEVGDIRAKLEEAQFPDVIVSDVYGEGVTPGTQFIINTSTPEGMDAQQYLVEVQSRLQEIFKGELARNDMTIGELTPVTAEQPAPKAEAAPTTKPAEKPAQPAAVEKPAEKPASDKQSSLHLTPGAGAHAALLPLLFGEAEPEKKADPTAAEKAAAEKPAAETLPKTPLERTKTTLSFKTPVAHATLERAFHKAVEEALGPGISPDIEISNDEYEEGSMVPYAKWDVRIALPVDRASAVFQALETHIESGPIFPSSNTIGGAVASITRNRAIYALIASTLFILLYLWVRFQRITYGVGAVVSLMHDVLLAIGFVALAYYFSLIPLVSSVLLIEPFKINLVMVTAFLTIAGYSLNDTIVIYDRIREVRGKAPYLDDATINKSINQTLGRTLLTGVTTITTLLSLYILGGPTIHGFAYAMLIGVIVGTYSSIYIASPFLLWISGDTNKKQ